MTEPIRAEAPSDVVQLLTPEGERVEESGGYRFDGSPEQCCAFYRDLVLARRFDAEATALQRQGELQMWIPSVGQEGAQVGAARALSAEDFAFPSYREHAVALCRGVDPVTLLGFCRGVDFGGWDPHKHNFANYTIVIGAQVLHAAGYAMGVQRDGADSAVIAFFGDGATSQGDVNEALVWASVFNVPLVFFCQNNQWAISEPTERQSRVPLYRRASGFGLPGVRVDGNDVLAVFAVVSEALARARSGAGPVFIEALTYRMGPHTTSDDPTRYRLDSELETWKLRDPLLRMKAYLSRHGLADREFFDSVDTQADELASYVRSGCLALQSPPALSMFEDVYAGGSTLLDEERAAFAGYRASFADGPGD